MSGAALNRAVYELIAAPARWRLDHNFFSFPVELWTKNLVDKVISPPKPIVDAAPLQSGAGDLLRQAKWPTFFSRIRIICIRIASRSGRCSRIRRCRR